MSDADNADKFWITNRLRMTVERWDKEKPAQIAVALKNKLTAIIVHWKQQFDALPAGADRARMANKVADQYMTDSLKSAREAGMNVSCKRGCSSCCHQLVEVTPDEADLLAERVSDGVKLNLERLKRQSEFAGDAGEWFLQPAADSRCIFLDERNDCRVYRDRPLACRTYFVATPAEHCSPNMPGHKVGIITSERVEAFVSAMKNLEYLGKRVAQIRPLPVMLYERIKGGE